MSAVPPPETLFTDRTWLMALATAALIIAAPFIFHHSRRLFTADLSASMALLVVGGAALGKRSAGRPERLAPLIAIVGCDGSGKSTLAADLQRDVARFRPTQVCYLGLRSGDLGVKIKRMPLLGPALERLLARKAGETRTVGQKIPGLATALVVFAFSLIRRRRFRHVLRLRRHGVAVITDRYPQTDVPGFYDGPGLSAGRAVGHAVTWLAARERRMYDWMAGYRPTVVIRLNIDAQTAHARKPDHALALLSRKVAVTAALRFNGAPIIDLDARRDYDQVRQDALRIVDDVLRRGYQA